MKNLKDIKLKNQDVLIIDGMNLFHRAYNKFKFLSTSGGVMTGGVYGYINSLVSYTNQFSTNKIIVCWEGRGKTKRHKFYPDYKKSRADRFTPEEKMEFQKSLKMVQNALFTLGVISVVKSHYEADDLIWYLSKVLFKEDVVIVSNDKDLLQLVHDKMKIKVFRPDKSGNGRFMGYNDVVDFLGVSPGKVKYYLAIAGDAGDNVPGVRNYGKVKATSILNSGNFDIKKIGSIFNNKQAIEFKKSLKCVWLGYGMRNFKLTKQNVIVCNGCSLARIQDMLDKYEIRRFTPLELTVLSNLAFKNEFYQKIIEEGRKQ